MKTQLLILTLLISGYANSQTILKKIPITGNDPFSVYSWAYDPEIGKWRWASTNETLLEYYKGWNYYREVSIKVDKYDVFEILLIRGYEYCSDTTRVTIYGSFDRTKIKDKAEFRKQILLNGEHQYFGKRIERP